MSESEWEIHLESRADQSQNSGRVSESFPQEILESEDWNSQPWSRKAFNANAQTFDVHDDRSQAFDDR